MVRSGHLPVLLCSALLVAGCGGGDGPATPGRTSGRLGHGSSTLSGTPVDGIDLFGVSRDEPVMVVRGHLFLGIAVGVSHTCGIRVDGALFCWGDGGSGRLGDGATVNRAGPVRVMGS